MNILILTQALRANYGGLLQAYALQTICKRLGHKAVTDIYGDNTPSRFTKMMQITCIYNEHLLWLKKLIAKLLPSKKKQLLYAILMRNTKRFVDQHIDTVKFFNLSHQPSKSHLNFFDAVIVGSDQVWRPDINYIPSYFLDAVKQRDDMKKVAYAASFGLDHWELYPEQLTNQCRTLVQAFDAISVREDSGVDLCAEHLGVDAMHVLDPTMLLEKEDYIALIEEVDREPLQDVMMSYVLDSSAKNSEIIQYLSDKLQLNPYQVKPNEMLNRNTTHYNACSYPSVSAWLKGMRDAKFVVTDSFHGTVFAIIFNVPFVTITNKLRGAARFNSLLSIFGLESRLIENIEDITDDHLQNMDFSEANKRRKEWQIMSLGFLTRGLGQEG